MQIYFDTILDGKNIDEKCPICGSDLVMNKANYIWCSSFNCTYSDDENLSYLFEYTKNIENTTSYE